MYTITEYQMQQLLNSNCDRKDVLNEIKMQTIIEEQKKICPQCREKELEEYQTVCSACEFDERS